MDLELEQLIGVTRIVFYFGITAMVAFVYKPRPTSDSRMGVSLVATLLAGFSFALGTVNMLTWNPHHLATVKELLATGFVGVVFLLTIITRGNVAKMIPRGVWR